MIEAWFDGSCEPNPGPNTAYGAYATKDGVVVWSESIMLPKSDTNTCNLAEYAGFRAVLKYILKEGHADSSEIKIIRGDSKMVINQMFKNWAIKKGAYVETARECAKLLLTFKATYGEWIPRESNGSADALSKAPLEALRVLNR